MQKGITDGTLVGDPLGSNDDTILKPLLSTREYIKKDTKGGVLDGYLDGILLGTEPDVGDGYILGSDDGISLEPW